MWEEKIALIDNSVKGCCRCAKAEIVLPPVANHTPSLSITWDDKKVKNLLRNPWVKNYAAGTPSIEVISRETDNNIRLTVFMLKPGEKKVVARRIKEELVRASA